MRGKLCGAHVVVAHVLLDLVELPSVLLACGISLREQGGEHGDKGAVEARTEYQRDDEGVEFVDRARLDEAPRDCEDLRDCGEEAPRVLLEVS